MARFRISVLPGDGIGPEVTREALRVLDAVAERWSHRFDREEDLVGGAAIDRYGTALRQETLERARKADAVLFGAVGGPKWDDPRAPVRPEQALLGLRKGLGLFANLRPVRAHDELLDASPLRAEVVRGTDMLVVRELTGGLYFGRPQRRWRSAVGRQAVDTMRYSEPEILRVAQVAFELARGRRKRVTHVHKANILDTSRLWREVVEEVARGYPDVELDHLLVDACAMHLVRRPASFDVILTENMFGDILTDEASMVAGSMGMLPSASLGRRRSDGTGRGLYEPIHGSAPDITGKSIANPLAMILSTALMLRYSCGLPREAEAVEAAVDSVIARGLRTPDIAAPGQRSVSTPEMGDAVVATLRS